MENLQNVTFVVGSCMDRILNLFIDEVASKHAPPGRFAVVRSAGATIRGLLHTIDELVGLGGIKCIHFYTHNDCGACHFVFEAIRDHVSHSKRRAAEIVDYLAVKNKMYSSPIEVEAANMLMLNEALHKYKDMGIEVNVKEVDMHTVNAPKEAWSENMTLVFGKPFRGSFSELAGLLGLSPWKMFSINANNIADVMPDIDVAVIALKIRKIKILSTCPGENKWADEQMEILKQMEFMQEENMEAEVLKLV
jgi:carbonic anhydrase